MTNNKSIKLLSDFISIQSVSTDPSRHGEILKAVRFLKKEIKSLRFEVNIYQKNNCPPLVIAKHYLNDDRLIDRKTIGVYAHYDVQPEDPVEKWGSPPFKLDLKGGKMFGRGIADDKGHIIQILIAVKKLIETKKLRNNLVLIFEGEEEVGSKNFESLVSQVKKDLEKIDVFYLLDMGMKAKNIPQIFYGLKGIIAFELKIKTSETDLHSGVYGNRALNPAQLLSELMSKMKDSQTGKIKIPEFYNQVKKNQLKPSLDINGMVSGYTGEGTKTIIPAEATVKFSIRLVPDQDHKKIERLVQKFIKNNLPEKVYFQLKIFTGSNPFHTDFKNAYAEKTAKILNQVFKNKTHFNRSGGSIAAAEILQRLFAKPIILTGFTLPDENIHAPNENIDEEMFFKGIVSLEEIFSL